MTEHILKIKNLTFSVDEKEILSNISFQVKKGELVTISGPSGSGKSTLLKLVANMLPITRGNILFNNQSMTEYQSTVYRQAVSYFFQSPVLFGETVRDNLSFPYEIRQLEFDKEHAISLLKDVQLDQSFLDKKITSLSGGEKQRVAFVRNLLFLPEVLLLDEVTSALDEENSQIIHSIISKLNKENNVTILWITHDKNEYLTSNRRLFIEDGLLKEDTHE
ncbi:ABC transporter ATP-binding protein [Vagococcus fluvialis]|uniref:ABC transporter ATP-binding protein n=1 Tax=Vagococcus fluvialis TaxID=2738 RepID=UPI003D128CDE